MAHSYDIYVPVSEEYHRLAASNVCMIDDGLVD
jgi:hypothetical protein